MNVQINEWIILEDDKDYEDNDNDYKELSKEITQGL